MRGSFRRWVCAGAAGAAALWAAGDAAAQERFNPRVGLVTSGFFYRSTTALRVNPIGLFSDFRVGLRVRLFNDPGRGVLLRNTYAALGASAVLSPAFARVGLAAEVQPLQIINLQVIWEPVFQWFGTFSNLQTYPNVGASRSGAGVLSSGSVYGANETAPADNFQRASAWQLTFQGTLQARIGRTLAIRNTFRAVRSEYFKSSLGASHQGDRVYYDPFYDVAAPLDGWVFANDLDVVAQLTDVGTNIGIRYSAVLPQHDEAADPTVASVDLATHRVGPIVTYTFRERRHGWFNAPTLFVLAQWWLRHQWRTGNDGAGTVTQAMPMIIVGFSFRGDA